MLRENRGVDHFPLNLQYVPIFHQTVFDAVIRNRKVRISESITVGTQPDVIEVSPTVLVPLWYRRDIGKEFYTVRVHE
jgi:hypothetical protein